MTNKNSYIKILFFAILVLAYLFNALFFFNYIFLLEFKVCFDNMSIFIKDNYEIFYFMQKSYIFLAILHINFFIAKEFYIKFVK